MIPVYLDHFPGGSSTRPFVHYAQLHSYDYEFKKFDFGQEENMQRYGQTEPPHYDLSNVQAPLHLWTADKDYLGKYFLRCSYYFDRMLKKNPKNLLLPFSIRH